MSDKNKRFTLSNGASINSKGYRIDVDGIDLTRFNANPVMLYGHDTDKVIGRWIGLQKENNQLTGTPDFDLDDDFAKEVAGKVERGFLNGASIGIIVHKIQNIDGVDVVTKSELFEASIVSVPADGGAIRLYNEALECVSIEKLKLSVDKETQTDSFEDRYKDVCVELELSTSSNVDDVLQAIRTLKKPDQESEINKALQLGVINEKEHKHYLHLSKHGIYDVSSMLEDKQTEYTEMRQTKLLSLFDENNEKILTYLGLDGWEVVKELHINTVENIISKLPDRIYLNGMVQKLNGEARDLDWYRKHNPKALRDDPTLYKQLLSIQKEKANRENN